MAFTLSIQTDNEAFSDLPQLEVARILRKVADKVRDGDDSADGPVFDINGNRVGQWTLDTNAAGWVNADEPDTWD